MTSSLVDRLAGVAEGLAIKAPVRAATTANITLAGPQTIDGVAVTETSPSTRVLVKDQTDARQNGIYDVSTGNWTRSADFDGSRDVVKGTRVTVLSGGEENGDTEWVLTSDAPISFGVTEISFAQPNWSIIALTEAAVATKLPINVMDFGAVADGSSHPLSSRYGSLAAAQAVYPFATSLTQQIDYCAAKAAANAAFGADGAEHGASYWLNRPLYFPAGRYNFGANTLLIRNLGTAKIYGDGKLATKLSGSGTPLAFDGIWYSTIEDMQIETTGSSVTAVLDIDGNVPGHPYATRGVQGVWIENVLVNGNLGADFCIAVCRQGLGSAQGDNVNVVNCHLLGAKLALYRQQGTNAVSNRIIGGDMQWFQKYGVWISDGTVHVIGTTYENSFAEAQFTNDGADIYFDGGSVGAFNIIEGCRTEGYRFVKFVSGNVTHVRSCSQGIVGSVWQASHAYAVGDLRFPIAAGLGAGGRGSFRTYRLYRCTTAGTSDASEPAWPLDPTATVSDGTCVWQEYVFDYINVGGYPASVDFATVRQRYAGNVVGYDPGRSGIATSITSADSPYYIEDAVELFVDATAGDVDVWLPIYADATSIGGRSNGRRVRLCRVDASAHVVTVHHNLVTGGGGFTSTAGSYTTDTLPAATGSGRRRGAFSCIEYMWVNRGGNCDWLRVGAYGAAVNPPGSEIANLGYAVGRYYFGEFVSQASGTIALSANTIYFEPFRVTERTTWSKIGAKVTAAAGTNARLGIYRWAGGVPTDLVLDCGTVSTAGTGAVEATISQTLEIGLYALAVLCDGAPTLAGSVLGQAAAGLIGQTTVGTGDSQLSATFTYGALPASLTFGSGGIGAFTYSSSNCPQLWLRR